ncbi:MAG: N-acetylmuramoyl-L-alanine amidase [Verrucomicrobia bacterium]|nr:N-acetylmuramoyl-L-alanine amidase [Verrucomicrobiota bacterium]
MFGSRTALVAYWPLWIAGPLLLFLGGCAPTPSGRTLGGPQHFSTVVIDPGHGGKDSGGVSGRRASIFLREKDLTLETAKRVRDELRRAGLRTVMTREDDHFVELDDRVRLANQQGRGAVLVSIHYDAVSDSGFHGAKTFFWRADSHGLATRVQRHLVAATGETDLGVIRRRLRLTRNPEIPCILCECAYVTNPAEAQKVSMESYRRRIASGIAQGILEEHKLGDAGIAPVPELSAPLSRGSDKYQTHTTRRSHGHS